MSVAQVKDEIAKLESKERDQLIAYLVGLRERESESFRKEVTEMIDDRERSNWKSLDDLDRALGEGK